MDDKEIRKFGKNAGGIRLGGSGTCFMQGMIQKNSNRLLEKFHSLLFCKQNRG